MACGFAAPHDAVPSLCSGQALLFRQKDPKPLAPGRGPHTMALSCHSELVLLVLSEAKELSEGSRACPEYALSFAKGLSKEGICFLQAVGC